MPDVESNLYDATEMTLGGVLQMNEEALETSVETVLSQVKAPRANLGGTGPPGRAD